MLKNLVNSFNRILAAITDLFISLNVYSFFYALGPYQNFENSIGYTWPVILLNYVAFRSLFTLILGTSLSQYIFGLRTQGGFFWKRLGGFLRTVYEIPSILLFPLAEFPILLGKRTLKEFLSQTVVLQKGKRISFFGIFIFLPLAFFLAIFSPFYEVLFTQNPTFSSKIFNLTQKELRPDSTYEVQSAGLRTFSGLMKDRYVLIPSFKMTKRGSENKYCPQYIVYDKMLKRNLSFYFEKGMEIISWIKVGKLANPLFKIFYPGLNSLEDSTDGLVLSQQNSEEFELFLENSLRLDASNPFNYIQNNGIFVKGPLSLKNEILKKYPAEKIEKIKLGDKTFLCFKERRNGKMIETFIPLFLKNGFVLKLSHSLDPNFRNDFLSTFFYFSKWNAPNDQGAYFLRKGELDYKKFAAESLLNSAKESMALKDSFYQDTVLDGLDRFLFVTQLKGGLDFDVESLIQMKLLKNALLEKSFALKGN